MGCSQNLICRLRLHHFAVSFLIIVISTSSHLRLLSVEGRKLAQNTDNSKTMKEEKGKMSRVQIGSRPPHCERRCSSCANCEAIQVPTNPPIKISKIKKSTSTVSAIIAAYARGDDDSSNYKPMSWKCKCGSFIFNP
ncbi:hypothetical protein ACJIZ3_014989 [Penstemon smallii]|uniref:Epidermal patterning factor-like protein n=1 Tax=Penstemon smallii TaxID=265156 RepID=A0ABD3RPM2_9LAMI